MAVVMVVREVGLLFHPWPAVIDHGLQRFSAGAVFYGAALLCAMRGQRSPQERFAWRSFAMARVVWGSADLYYSAVLSQRSTVPYPSVSDALWLAFYLPAFAAICSLLRRRAGSLPRGVWLDALIGSVGVGSAAAVAVFGVVLNNTSGTAAATATNLAYPVGDLGLLALVVAAVTVTGWRAAGVWRWIAVAMGIFVVADSIYLVRVAQGTYALGGQVDLGWPLAALLIGVAAHRNDPVHAPAERTTTRIVLPALSGLLGVTLLAVDHFVRTNFLALALAIMSLVLIVFRQFQAVRDNTSLLERSRTDATTDALTGLGNRRQLTIDLARHLGDLDPQRPLTLTMFDLDGFKQYNDTFGHPAGDQLLARLATRLRDYVGRHGTAYRMGGDEFCTLWTTSSDGPAKLTAADAGVALSEHGEAFSIGCSHGSVLLPREANDAGEALRIADHNMYMRKRNNRVSAGRQSIDVLHRVLAERDRQLGDHMDVVADLAAATARRLHLSAEDIDLAVQTALLHDMGKVAIPDAILAKPRPLDAHELAFVQQHTIIGERILSAAPALATVAKLVRSTHERHDGSGYPDGLAGDQIPLIARIVSACDAFDAMTTHRPHANARTQPEAIDELRRCANTQFAPDVVTALVAVLEASSEPASHDNDDASRSI